MTIQNKPVLTLLFPCRQWATPISVSTDPHTLHDIVRSVGEVVPEVGVLLHQLPVVTEDLEPVQRGGVVL